MNARRYRYSVLLPLALLLSLGCDASANAAVTSNEVSIVAELSQSPVAFDGRTRVDVTVEWTGAADRYIAAWPETPSLDGLRVVGSRQETASWVEDGIQKTRQTFSWIVAPERIGVAHVGVVETIVRDAVTGSSRRISTAPVPVEVVRGTKTGRFRWSQVIYGSVALVIVVVVADEHERNGFPLSICCRRDGPGDAVGHCAHGTPCGQPDGRRQCRRSNKKGESSFHGRVSFRLWQQSGPST